MSAWARRVAVRVIDGAFALCVEATVALAIARDVLEPPPPVPPAVAERIWSRIQAQEGR